MSRARAVWLAALAVFAVMTLHAQGPVTFGAPPSEVPKGTGLVIGQVVDASTNRPIANAIVALSGGPAVGREMVEMGLGRPNPAGRIITDGQGRFVFHDLGAGIYTFNTSATGYLDGAYGQRRPSGPAQPFVLGDDQRVGNVTIRLWREASMGGTVTDDVGEPVVGKTVSLQKRNQANGRTQVSMVNSARTDDRGVYRFAKLLPGDYRIVVPSGMSSVPVPSAAAYASAIAGARGGVASSPVYQSIVLSRGVIPTSDAMQVGDALIQLPRYPVTATPPFLDASGRLRSYPTMYFPNATSAARAAIVTVEAGDERNGLDIQLQSAPLVGVSGVVTGPNGPEPNFGVRLYLADDVGQDAASTTTDGRGAFSFVGVVPGQYILKGSLLPRATGSAMNIVTFSTGNGGVALTTVEGGPGRGGPPPLPDEPALWAEMTTTVGEEPVTGIELQLQAAPTVSGRLVFDGAGAQPTPDKLQGVNISLTLANGQALPYCCPASRVTADGRFTTQGYPPDKYYVNPSNVPSGWSLRSVTAGGKDALHAPLALSTESGGELVLTFSEGASEIRGVVNDQTGKATPTASVALFPANFQDVIGDGLNPRLVRLSRPSPQTGAFQILNLIPGDYFIVAADDLAIAKWPDSELMKTYAGVATRITVGAGEKKTQDLVTRRP